VSLITLCEICGLACPAAVFNGRCPEALIPVRAEAFEEFAKAFAKLVKKAVKLGCELPTYEVATEYSLVHFTRETERAADTEMRWTNNAIHRAVLGHTPIKAVRVTGPRPKFAGWSLLATLEPLQTPTGTVNLIKSIPGAGELPVSFRTGDHCDHCRTRRNRSETFVVKGEDGSLMRVGRNCIADFLGGKSPANVAAMFAYATEIASFGGDSDGEGWGGGRGPSAWDLSTYVALVIRDITETGWLSRKDASERGGCATADSAFARMVPPPMSGRRAEVPTAEELAKADDAIAWCATMSPRSDFDFNISAIAQTGAVTGKTMGMAAAIFGAFERVESRAAEARKSAVSTANSAHQGTVKARLYAVLTVTRIYDAESEWGATHIHTMTDEAGNVYKWFASAERLEIGTTYHVRGTVKGHGEYKGVKETSLTRCACDAVESETVTPKAVAAWTKWASQAPRTKEPKKAEKVAGITGAVYDEDGNYIAHDGWNR
jgi:hypothetical protein